jgi:hypothetical protein
VAPPAGAAQREGIGQPDARFCATPRNNGISVDTVAWRHASAEQTLVSSDPMDVFVIPVADDRYELYCETPVEDDAGPDADGSSADHTGSGLRRRWRTMVNRWRARWSAALKAAEHRQPPEAESEPSGWVARQHERMLAWVAERVVEQRLLWNLRRSEAAVIAHPQDMTFEQAMELVRTLLQREYERHRRWMVIDGILFVITFVALGPLFLLVPGVANLPALYFGFRTIGHWLSMRGARNGLDRTVWCGRACQPLTDLRALATLDPHARETRLADIATRLRLAHLARFYERVAV